MLLSKFLSVSAFLLYFICYASEAQVRSDCGLKADVSVENSLSNPNEKLVTVSVSNGVAPYKYLFFDEQSGRLLEKDLSKNYVDKLSRGAYYCLVIDNNSCSKKIQFSIQ